MARDARFCPYVDLPVQHASDRVLRRMGRRENRASLEALLAQLRAYVPEVSIRSTVMVGFPGETEEDFENLLDFIQKVRFDHLGCFKFSPQEGTAAYHMKDPVPEEVKQERFDRLMQVQQKISEEKLAERVGQEIEVLVEGVSEDGLFYTGRTIWQAPEIDSRIYLLSELSELSIGQYTKARIVESDAYELTGVVSNESIE